ncbi:MAG: hypothetical protein HYR56_25600 [Acidobacteria bacterium]|nr:hypothetical protein [Acidobacteriota bacterium]MBI3423290.1 hypothetical protein [Acidobacteriota bacterium]
MKSLRICLALALWFHSIAPGFAQAAREVDVFAAEIYLPRGEKIEKQKVRLHFLPERLLIKNEHGEDLKSLAYADLKAADYAYGKQPRWKEGMALTATGLLLGSSLAVLAVTPLLPLVAIIGGIKLAKSKGRSHWLTVRTADDYAVLRLNKQSQRLVIAAFEMHSQVKVEILPDKEQK